MKSDRVYYLSTRHTLTGVRLMTYLHTRPDGQNDASNTAHSSWDSLIRE
jgi:hypothetical protein